MINESRLDRAFRILLGAVLLSLVFVGPKTAWGYIGAVPLLTGLVGHCPLYRVLGVSSCRHDDSPTHSAG
jgi:hypothetical protein